MKEYTFSDLSIGMKESFTRTITKELEDSFREITGDLNPLHYDDEYAREIGEGRFKGHVTFGMLTASLYSTICGMYLPGKYSLIHSLEDIAFKTPVYVGDELTVTGEIIETNESLKLIVLKVIINNQDKKTVSKAKIKVIVQK